MGVYPIPPIWGCGPRPQGNAPAYTTKSRAGGSIFLRAGHPQKNLHPGPYGPTLDFVMFDMARQLRRRLRGTGTSTCPRAPCFASVPYRPAYALPPSRPPYGGKRRAHQGTGSGPLRGPWFLPICWAVIKGRRRPQDSRYRTRVQEGGQGAGKSREGPPGPRVEILGRPPQGPKYYPALDFLGRCRRLWLGVGHGRSLGPTPW